MDKTGTLTKGEPEVTDVIADGIDEHRAARAGGGGRARVRAPARGRGRPVRRADEAPPACTAERFSNVPGHGATATVDGHRVVVGNRRLMADRGHRTSGPRRDADELAATGRTAIVRRRRRPGRSR